MTCQAYFLEFTTPLHIGDYKPDSYETTESFLRSDTIIAAIISAWAQIGKEEWIGDGNTPFTISSAFPYHKMGDEEILFFPRPKMQLAMSDRDPTLSKAIKKVTWLDQNYFTKVIHGDDVSSDLKGHMQGEFLTSATLPDDGFMYKQVSERVQIPRDRSLDNSEPFYMERIYFVDGGLYFLAAGDHLDRLDSALNFLKYEGFGTDRNVGNGFFEWNKKEINIEGYVDGEYAMALGLYCPESADNLKAEIDANVSYELIKRGGWVTTHGYQGIEKNSIYMMAEGSVLKKDAGISGKGNIDLKPTNLLKEMVPNHPVYRSGRTIFIPVKL